MKELGSSREERGAYTMFREVQAFNTHIESGFEQFKNNSTWIALCNSIQKTVHFKQCIHFTLYISESKENKLPLIFTNLSGKDDIAYRSKENIQVLKSCDPST